MTNKVNNILISVIVPLYKGEKYVDYIVKKIAANSKCMKEKYDNIIELLFINDYPKESIVIKNDKDYLLTKVINMDFNRGIHGARVKGLLEASGEYITFLDQDDKITDDYFLSQYSRIGTADAIICNGYMSLFGRNKLSLIYESKSAQNMVTNYNTFISLGNKIISPGQVLIKKKKIPYEWGEHIISVNGADDYLLWILMLSKNALFTVNEEKLYIHVDHGNNESSNHEKMADSLREIFKIINSTSEISAKDKENLGVVIDRIINSISSNKSSRIIGIYDCWMYLNERGLSINNYLRDKCIKSIAIYGMNHLGERLYCEIGKGTTMVKCGIDKNAGNSLWGLDVYSLDDRNVKKLLREVEMVVVTTVSDYDNIKAQLQKLTEAPIVAFQDIIISLALQVGADDEYRECLKGDVDFL